MQLVNKQIIPDAGLLYSPASYLEMQMCSREASVFLLCSFVLIQQTDPVKENKRKFSPHKRSHTCDDASLPSRYIMNQKKRYASSDGSVQVCLSEEEGQICCAVKDTGIGIPKEHQAHVFERFYRVDKSHSKQTGGTGLGLAIVKHAAQVHQAQVELESQPGEGTTVSVLFH